MDAQPASTLGSLLAIFNILDKAALEQHCRTAVIEGSDLANLILACGMEGVPIRHFPFHKHHHPEHLIPKDGDHEALGRNGVGPLSKDAKKFVNKIEQMFEQRRLFNGHLFISVEDLSHWHLLYFDQRDVDSYRNHWEHGEHIHLINMVTHPQLSVLDLVDKLEAEERPRLGGGFHIRYNR
jgi:hypothetical protein